MKNNILRISKSVLAFSFLVVACFVSFSSNAQFAEVKNTPFGFHIYHQIKNGSFVLLSDTSVLDESENKKPKISKEELVDLFVSINGGPKLKATYTGEMVKIITPEGKFQVPSGIGVIAGEGFEYSGSLNKGLMHGNGRFTFNKETYNGQFLNGKRNGTGEMIFSNGDEYKGNWTNDVIEGSGLMNYEVFYQDTRKLYKGQYDGQWVKGKKNGNGTSLWNGDWYTGNWIDDKRNGAGELSFYPGRELFISEVGGLNPVSFTGEWYNDSIKGVGELIYFESITPEDKKRIKEDNDLRNSAIEQRNPSEPKEISLTKKGPLTWNGFKVSGDVDVRFTNGNSFKGTLLEGKMLKGKLFFLLENTNVVGHKFGTWENGKFTGTAEIPYSRKSSYNGEMLLDKKHGYGKMIYADGTSYEGNWVNDIKSGQGKYMDTKGNVFTGIFADDKCTGIAQIKNADWSYEGEVSNYEPKGKGVKIFKNGDTLSGNWNEYGFNGIGKRREASVENSDEFYYSEGTWKNGQLNGEGTRYFRMRAPGYPAEDDYFLDAFYTGQFVNGIFNGKGNLKYENAAYYSIEGVWINGLCPKGKVSCEYGGSISGRCVISYEGDLDSDFKKQGFGTYKDCDGNTYVGYFANDSKEGSGKLTYRNGTIEQGTFVNDVFQIPFICKNVTIGNQVWMAENLNVAKFRNGDLIKQIKTKEEWLNNVYSGEPAWCYYDFNPANGVKYGKLYNWYAVNDSRGLAPAGWHVPSKNEFQQLINKFGYNTGTALKSKTGWVNQIYRTKIEGGTNTTGFNGFPAGNLYFTQYSYPGYYSFMELGIGTQWWSSTCCLDFDSSASVFQLDNYACSVSDNEQKAYGNYVRLVKD